MSYSSLTSKINATFLHWVPNTVIACVVGSMSTKRHWPAIAGLPLLQVSCRLSSARTRQRSWEHQEFDNSRLSSSLMSLSIPSRVFDFVGL
jgi:hypothetical protein